MGEAEAGLFPVVWLLGQQVLGKSQAGPQSWVLAEAGQARLPGLPQAAMFGRLSLI
ncbi:MAG TPA: hypothetical protein VKD70_11520 [Candidatus Acidoferrum sp.]|nr:hypothetical protein [Candidatus Acidoferrum sp.]